MRIYAIDSKQVLKEVKCNKCGRILMVENGVAKEGVFSAEQVWGYFSDKDGEHHSFDLCEKCYDEMVREFLIEPDIIEENELV